MSRLSVLDGVRNQVDQDLAQPLLVGVDVQRQMWRALVQKVDALGGRLQAEHVHQLVQELHQLHFVAIQAQQAVLNARDIQEAVNEVGKVFGTAANDPHGIFARCPALRSMSWA